jgi:hypothetical protein
MSDKKSQEGVWLKVFCPGARCLTPEEVVALPEDKRQAAQDQGKEGLWLEMFCPDGACLTEEERLKVPVKAEPVSQTGPASQTGSVPQTAQGKGQDKGYWLKLFCPEDACQIDDGGKAP